MNIAKNTTIRNLLYKSIRTYNILLAILPSIAFYRATVQPEYKWGLLVINGKGTSTEYLYLVLFMLFAWTTFSLETWYKRKWYYILPVLLFSLVSTVLFIGYFSEINMFLQGDVWKFKFDIGLAIIIISAIFLILLIAWTVLDLKQFKASNLKFSRLDKIKLLIVISISAIILLLFNQGQGGVHTITDGIAVGLTIIQALFLANIIDNTGKKS